MPVEYTVPTAYVPRRNPDAQTKANLGNTPTPSLQRQPAVTRELHSLDSALSELAKTWEELSKRLEELLPQAGWPVVPTGDLPKDTGRFATRIADYARDVAAITWTMRTVIDRLEI